MRVLCVLLLVMNLHVHTSLADFSNTDSKDMYSRSKRSCDKSKVQSMDRFIEILETIENDTDTDDSSAKAVSNQMRTIFDDRFFWEYFCFQTDKNIPPTVLNAVQYDDLKNTFIKHTDQHVNSKVVETGVARAGNGDTISVGHMAVGVSCGGFARDPDMTLAGVLTSSKLDNLHVVTLAGDLGQTTLSFHNSVNPDKTLVGPGGSWDTTSCPLEFTLNRAASESTEAEILGDIDGIILATIIPDIKNENLKFSQMLKRYYGGDGLGPGGIFKDSNRMTNYKMLVQDHFMTQQAVAFIEAYSVLLNYKNPSIIPSQKKLKSKVPQTMKAFKALNYVNICNQQLADKYTVKHFIEVVKILEKEKSYGIEKMASSILEMIPKTSLKPYLKEFLDIDDDHKRTDGFYWQVMRDLVTHEFINDGSVPKSKQQEVGVLSDFHGSVVAIGNVLAGIQAGKNNGIFTSADDLDGATVAGAMAKAAMKEEQLHRRRGLIGEEGQWTQDCPPKYILTETTPHLATVAELTGAIDGYILGAQNSDLKLSEVLEKYYTSGSNSDGSVKSSNRIEQFTKTYGGTNGKRKLEDQIKKSCDEMTSFFKSSSNCGKLAAGAAVEFQYKILSEVEVSPKSGVLPDYDVLEKSYKGYLGQGGSYSSDGVKDIIGGGATDTSIGNTDALRISLLLNELGHVIDPNTQSTGKTVVGKNGKTYIRDVATLEDYLTNTYGAAFVAASPSNLAAKRGILSVSTKASGKVIGLWDGTKMYQITNFASHPVNSLYLWQSSDCAWLARSSDCSFYTCVENNILHCGENGYAIGYAHRYCNKFMDYLHLFNDNGKQWVNNVKSCLMNNLLPIFKNIRHQSSGSHASCENIKQIAFKSHPDCYTAGQPNFCDVVKEVGNWLGLMAVFETGDFFGVDGKLAIDQIWDTYRLCKQYDKSTIEDALDQSGTSLHPLKTIDASSDVTSECETFANQGDCRFYECFEKRFPCHDLYGTSHVRGFELISCKKFQSRKSMMDSKGESWLLNSNKCLMQDLLPMYRTGSINCASLDSKLSEKRNECFIQHGICEVLDSSKDKFALDNAMNTRGFPCTPTLVSITSSPILDSTVINIDSYYFQSTISLQRMMGPLAEQCHDIGKRDSPLLYIETQSDQCVTDSCTLKIDQSTKK